MPWCQKNVILVFGKEQEMGVMQTSLYVFWFLCKINYNSDKYIYNPTYSYNEVMC